MTLARKMVTGLVVLVLWSPAWSQIPGSAQTVHRTAEQASRKASVKAEEMNDAVQKTAGEADSKSVAVSATGGPGSAASAVAPESKPTAKDGKAMVERLLSGRGRRDPFVSVIQTRSGGSAPDCKAGRKCLFVDQLVLKGVVKQTSGMLAVVENAQRKAYFLREKDPVFNGEVVRITGDSIVFREKVYDKLGRAKLRDVVKQVPGSRPQV